jgi:ATP-dependent DNA helicase PIF1
MVTFKVGYNLNGVAARESTSMLIEYFVASQKHAWSRDILYKDFPGRFTWQPTKYSKKRDKGNQVGRIVSVHPAEGERYFLRVLLNHVQSPSKI